MGTSVSQIKSEVFSDLGGGPEDGTGVVVKVELTDTQYANIIKESKRWFTSRKGFVVFRPLQLIDGMATYTLKEDVMQVLDVVFQVPSDVAAFFSLGFFDIIPYGPSTTLSMGSMSNYSGFAQLIDFTEQRKRVFSVEPDWRYEQQTRKLYLQRRGPTPTGQALVYCKLNEFDPVNLNDKDDYLFVSYVKAKCKQVVGRIRSKYDTMPGAGGPVGMDGQRLIEEAKGDIELLEKEIFSSQGPDMPLTG